MGLVGRVHTGRDLEEQEGLGGTHAGRDSEEAPFLDDVGISGSLSGQSWGSSSARDLRSHPHAESVITRLARRIRDHPALHCAVMIPPPAVVSESDLVRDHSALHCAVMIPPDVCSARPAADAVTASQAGIYGLHR